MGIFRWGRAKSATSGDAPGNGAATATNGTTNGAAASPPPAAPEPTAAPAVATPVMASATAAPVAAPAPVAAAPVAAPPAPVADTGFQSTMMHWPLTLQHTLDRATHLFGDREVVTNTENGPRRTTYAAWGQRVNQLAGALTKLGIKPGDRVGTLGWNTDTHLELYFAAPCIGAVLHTLNLRLFPKDLAFIINDAQDSVIF
ncbi:MAG TPA: AMP-binding protein, partial [Ktedonobacterales bacterium]|nr:AMP-binding protein [Ktedonobacterales bacterium]